MHSTCLPCSMQQCFPNPSIPQSGNRYPQDACVLLLSLLPSRFLCYLHWACTVLHSTASYCTALHYTVLYYTVLHYTLYYTALHYTAKHNSTVLHYTAKKTIHSTALHYSTARHCIAQHSTVLALHCTAQYCTTISFKQECSAFKHYYIISSMCLKFFIIKM